MIFLWRFFYDFDLWIGKKIFWFYENFILFNGYFYDLFMILLGRRGRKKT
jgi:hypothetical protein